MPIRAYLDGHKFDGETIRRMGIAFEMALASLRATRGYDDPIRAALAQRIIARAKAGERDAERLCEGALKVLPRTRLRSIRWRRPGQTAPRSNKGHSQ